MPAWTRLCKTRFYLIGLMYRMELSQGQNIFMKCPILSGKRPYGLFTNHMSQHVLIIGSGALACLFAARLTRIGQPVFMTGSWEAGVSAIRKDGVGLLVDGKIDYSPVSILDNSQST